jgi:hypothetical protein
MANLANVRFDRVVFIRFGALAVPSVDRCSATELSSTPVHVRLRGRYNPDKYAPGPGYTAMPMASHTERKKLLIRWVKDAIKRYGGRMRVVGG